MATTREMNQVHTFPLLVTNLLSSFKLLCLPSNAIKLFSGSDHTLPVQCKLFTYSSYMLWFKYFSSVLKFSNQYNFDVPLS